MSGSRIEDLSGIHKIRKAACILIREVALLNSPRDTGHEDGLLLWALRGAGWGLFALVG